MFIDVDEPMQRRVAAILIKFPRLVGERKARTSADAFVIALALERNLHIVTEERPTGSTNRPNIPDVLLDADFTCPRLDLLGLIKAEKWKFGCHSDVSNSTVEPRAHTLYKLRPKLLHASLASQAARSVGASVVRTLGTDVRRDRDRREKLRPGRADRLPHPVRNVL
jgi:Domain of unknown function (DUF4411)